MNEWNIFFFFFMKAIFVIFSGLLFRSFLSRIYSCYYDVLHVAKQKHFYCYRWITLYTFENLSFACFLSLSRSFLFYLPRFNNNAHFLMRFCKRSFSDDRENWKIELLFIVIFIFQGGPQMRGCEVVWRLISSMPKINRDNNLAGSQSTNSIMLCVCFFVFVLCWFGGKKKWNSVGAVASSFFFRAIVRRFYLS